MNFWVSPYEPHAIVFSALQNGLQQTLFLPVGATRVKLLKVNPDTINVVINVAVSPLILRVVSRLETQAILILKSFSERVGSGIEIK